MRTKAPDRATPTLAVVVAAAVAVLVGACSTGSGGAAGPGTTSADSGSGGVVAQSVARAPDGPTWSSGGIRFTLPQGWSVVSGAALADDPAALDGVSAVSALLGLESDRFAASLSGYEQIGFGPDAGLLFVTSTPQADQDATTEESVRTYLSAVCSRQPRMCEELVSFDVRGTTQGDAVVYVTRGATGYLSASVLVPYVARAGSAAATPQGRRVSIESSSAATLQSCVDALVATIAQG